MKLYQIKIRPLSGWLTSWQADTVFGMLCCVAARSLGGRTLTDLIIDPALRGRPPFVLSDAFPGDLLPVPVTLRLRRWPIAEYKKIKRARWLTRETFQAAQRGNEIAAEQLLPDVYQRTATRYRNSIDRLTNTTGDNSLFTTSETFLCWDDQTTEVPILIKQEPYLSIYLRVTDGQQALVSTLFRALSDTGFGAGTSTGAGQFEVIGDLEPMDQLDDEHGQPGSVVTLSTFQPAVTDPIDGYWDAFIKYGKIGQDIGLDNVTKRPMIMLKPGACFNVESQTHYLGRALRAADYVADEVSMHLRTRQIRMVHPAFGLVVPFPQYRDYAVA